MPHLAVIEFYDRRAPLTNVEEIWNADGHHVNAHSNGKTYRLLEVELLPIVIPPGWSISSEFPYRASVPTLAQRQKARPVAGTAL